MQAPAWPGDLDGWRRLLARARTLDGAALASLYAPDAAARAAGWLEGLTAELWAGAAPETSPDTSPKTSPETAAAPALRAVAG